MRRQHPFQVSLLVVFLVACSSAAPSADAPPTDAGAPLDASGRDGESMDASSTDGEPTDAATPDGEPMDTSVTMSDAGPADSATMDATDADAGPPTEAGGEDGEPGDTGATMDDGGEEGGEGGPGGGCEWGGAPGQCILVSACDALADHTPFAGQCPGPDDIQCCITTPSTADNPPTPAGYELMEQSEVTPDMTTWAVAILDDPTEYPMFSTTTMTFGALTVLARVEWHPPDFQNSAVHRGVTLYQPT